MKVNDRICRNAGSRRGDTGVVVEVGTGIREGRYRIEWDDRKLRTWIRGQFLTLCAVNAQEGVE